MIDSLRRGGAQGHFWTIWPMLQRRRQAWQAPESRPFCLEVEDPVVGKVPLSGKLAVRDPHRLVILVHGLGGCSDSLYLVRAAAIANRLGLSTLRLDLRGSDRQGHDIYHAGLWSDLAAVVASAELEDFEHIYVLGFSVGGHVVLRYASEVTDPRVAAVSAVCSPLDLASTVDHFDEPHRKIYQHYILRGLRDLYRQVDARARREGRTLPVPLERVLEVRGLREWDALTVVPRFGFGDTATYYRQASAGPHLARLRVPALLVSAEGDPMVTAGSVRTGLASHDPARLAEVGLEVRWIPRGGHVGFPDDFDLGLDAPAGMDPQVLAWLLQR